jgi:Tfp pilus assembly protein PilO
MTEDKKNKDQLIFEILTMIAIQSHTYNELIAKSLQELCDMLAEERRFDKKVRE